MWKLYSFKYLWHIQKGDPRTDALETVYSARWYPLAWLVFQYLRRREPIPFMLALHNEEVKHAT